MLALTRYLLSLLRVRLWFGWGVLAGVRIVGGNARALRLSRLPFLVIFFPIAIFNTIAGAICRLSLASSIHRTPIDPAPLFVLGHWRSGTTYLHELLDCDPRFLAPTGYQCINPSHFLLTERVLLPVAEFFTPRRRPMDDMVMSLQRAQEDEFAVLSLTARPFWCLLPATSDPRDTLRLDTLGPEGRAGWLRAWVYFLQSVVVRHPERRLLLKSPQHTARIADILSVFPDARFVHIARDPRSIYASTLRLWRAMSAAHGLGDVVVPTAETKEMVLATFETMYAHYLTERALVPEGHLVEVRYEDLRDDPEATLADIYARLDIGDFAEVRASVSARIAEGRKHKANVHVLDEHEAESVARRLAPYTAAFGYADDREGRGLEAGDDGVSAGPVR